MKITVTICPEKPLRLNFLTLLKPESNLREHPASIMDNIHLKLISIGLTIWLFFIAPTQGASAFDCEDVASIGAGLHDPHILP